MQKSGNQDDFILPHICLFLKHKMYTGEGGSQDNSSRGTGSCVLCKVCTMYTQAVTLAPIKTMFSSSMLGRSKGPGVGSRMGNQNPLDRL